MDALRNLRRVGKKYFFIMRTSLSCPILDPYGLCGLDLSGLVDKNNESDLRFS